MGRRKEKAVKGRGMGKESLKETLKKKERKGKK
jgi:hypothetical protein